MENLTAILQNRSYTDTKLPCISSAAKIVDTVLYYGVHCKLGPFNSVRSILRFKSSPNVYKSIKFVGNNASSTWSLCRHKGHFGTINNFRLGRLPSVPVSFTVTPATIVLLVFLNFVNITSNGICYMCVIYYRLSGVKSMLLGVKLSYYYIL